MPTLRPFQRIASQFQISEESAKYFLGRVQKSFKKEKPSHALILEFIEAQEFDGLPNPYDVAELMYESGVWEHDLGSPPPIFMDERDSD